jgi:ribosome maturation protein Sdo1
VNGSSRASLHHWQVDTNNWIACIIKKGHRQLKKQAKGVMIKPICNEILDIITQMKDHKWVEWAPDHSHARLFISHAIPDEGIQQTIAGRRKKLKQELPKYLEPEGWMLQYSGNKISIVRIP